MSESGTGIAFKDLSGAAPRPGVAPRVAHIVSVSGAQAVAVADHLPAVRETADVEIGATMTIPTPHATVVGIVSAVSVPMPEAATGTEDINLIELNLAGEIATDPAT